MADPKPRPPKLGKRRQKLVTAQETDRTRPAKLAGRRRQLPTAIVDNPITPYTPPLPSPPTPPLGFTPPRVNPEPVPTPPPTVPRSRTTSPLPAPFPSVDSSSPLSTEAIDSPLLSSSPSPPLSPSTPSTSASFHSPPLPLPSPSTPTFLPSPPSHLSSSLPSPPPSSPAPAVDNSSSSSFTSVTPPSSLPSFSLPSSPLSPLSPSIPAVDGSSPSSSKSPPSFLPPSSSPLPSSVPPAVSRSSSSSPFHPSSPSSPFPPPSSPSTPLTPTSIAAGGFNTSQERAEKRRISMEKLKALSPVILRELQYVESREKFMPGEVEELKDTELTRKGSKKSKLTLRSGKKVEISLVEGSFRRITGIREEKDDASRSITRRVEIEKQPGKSLGFFIREGDGWMRKDGIFVSRVNLGSSVQMNGLLGVGDEIVKVNNIDVTKMSLDNVVLIMQFVKRLILTAKILTSFNFKNTISTHKARKLPQTPSKLQTASPEDDSLSGGGYSLSSLPRSLSKEEKRARFKNKQDTVGSLMKTTSFGESFFEHLEDGTRKPSLSRAQGNSYEQVSFTKDVLGSIEEGSNTGSVSQRMLVSAEVHHQAENEPTKSSPPHRVLELNTGKVSKSQRHKEAKNVGDLRDQRCNNPKGPHPYEEMELSLIINPSQHHENATLQTNTTKSHEGMESSSYINPYASVTQDQGPATHKDTTDNVLSVELSSSIDPYASVTRHQGTIPTHKDTTNRTLDIELSSTIDPYASVTNRQENLVLSMPKPLSKQSTRPREEIELAPMKSESDREKRVSLQDNKAPEIVIQSFESSQNARSTVATKTIQSDDELVSPYASVIQRVGKPPQIIVRPVVGLGSAGAGVTENQSDLIDPYESVSGHGSAMKMDSLLELIRTKPIITSSPALKRRSDIIEDMDVLNPDHIKPVMSSSPVLTRRLENGDVLSLDHVHNEDVLSLDHIHLYSKINKKRKQISSEVPSEASESEGSGDDHEGDVSGATPPPPRPSSSLPLDHSMDVLASILQPLAEGGGVGAVHMPKDELEDSLSEKSVPFCDHQEGSEARAVLSSSDTKTKRMTRTQRHISLSELESVEDTPPPLPPPYVPDSEMESKAASASKCLVPRDSYSDLPPPPAPPTDEQEDTFLERSQLEASVVSFSNLPPLPSPVGDLKENSSSDNHDVSIPDHRLAKQLVAKDSYSDLPPPPAPPTDEQRDTSSEGSQPEASAISLSDLPPLPSPLGDQKKDGDSKNTHDIPISAHPLSKQLVPKDSYSDLPPPPAPPTDEQGDISSEGSQVVSLSDLPPLLALLGDQKEDGIQDDTAHSLTKQLVAKDSYSDLPPPPPPPTDDDRDCLEVTLTLSQDGTYPIHLDSYSKQEDNSLNPHYTTSHSHPLTAPSPVTKQLVAKDSYSDLPPPPLPPDDADLDSDFTNSFTTVTSSEGEEERKAEWEEEGVKEEAETLTRNLATASHQSKEWNSLPSTITANDSYSDLPPPPPPPTDPPDDDDDDFSTDQSCDEDGGRRSSTLLPTWSKEELKNLPASGHALSGIMILHVHGLDAANERSRDFWARYEVSRVNLTVTIDNSVRVMTNAAKVENRRLEIENVEEKEFKILLVKNSRLDFSISQVAVPTVQRTAFLQDILPDKEKTSKCVYVKLEKYGRLMLSLEFNPMSSAIPRLDIDSYSKSSFQDLVKLHPDNSGFPLVLEKCIGVVEQHGIKTPHLYQRCTPSSHKHRAVTACFKNLNSQSIKSVLVKCSIHAFTGLIVDFFCDLPEPFFTNQISSSLTQAVSLGQDVRVLENFLVCLPEEVIATWQLLLAHFKKLLKHSAKNGVTVKSLSRLFGPLLLVPSMPADVSANTTLLEYSEEYDMQAKVLTLLLDKELTA